MNRSRYEAVSFFSFFLVFFIFGLCLSSFEFGGGLCYVWDGRVGTSNGSLCWVLRLLLNISSDILFASTLTSLSGVASRLIVNPWIWIRYT